MRTRLRHARDGSCWRSGYGITGGRTPGGNGDASCPICCTALLPGRTRTTVPRTLKRRPSLGPQTSIPSLRSSVIADLRQRVVSGEKGSMKGMPFAFRSGLPSRSTR
jgi:hypothetical protein